MRPAEIPPVARALPLGVLFLSLSCTTEVPRPRLVLLYATCTLHRDAIAPYGGDLAYTPRLAAFARESVVFERHTTETDQSGPAYASIFAGAQVDRHLVFRHPARLADDLHLAAESFLAQGYDTHFWSGHTMASADLRYGQGVRPENVHVRRPGVAEVDALTANDPSFDRILEGLRQDRGYRAYAQVAFTLTHAPYTAIDAQTVLDFRRLHPREWPDLSEEEVARWTDFYASRLERLSWDFPKVVQEERLRPEEVATLARVLAAYYKVRVWLLDERFGRLVDRIRAAGLLEESLIAFTADHGETLYREDALFPWTHGLEVAPEAIQVPLLMRLPGPRPRAGRYEGVTRSIDVYPTLAGLSGFAVGKAQGVDGLNLARAVLGEEPPPSLRAFSHTTLLGPELVRHFHGWKVLEHHPSTDAEHMWVSLREGDFFFRLRPRDAAGWVVEGRILDGRRGWSPVAEGGPGPRESEVRRELLAYKARLLAVHARQGPALLREEAEAMERLRAMGYVR
jgi:arylsulfatase A-like enzyme